MTWLRFWITIAALASFCANSTAAELPPELVQLDSQFWGHYNANRVQESEAVALELVERADRLGQAHGRAIAMRDLAVVRSSMTNKPQQAVNLLNQATSIYEAAYGQDAAYGNLVENLAEHYFRYEDYTGAESTYRQVVPLYERLFGAKSVAYANVVYNVGLAIRRQGRTEESIAWYERSLPGYLKHNIRDAATVNEELGDFYSEVERFTEAKDRYEEARRIFTTLGAAAATDAARVAVTLTEIDYSQENYAEAIAALERLIPTLRAASHEHKGILPELARAFADLGDSYYWIEEYADAEAAYQASIDVYTELGGDYMADASATSVALSDVYHAQGRYADVIVVLTRWIPTLQAASETREGYTWELGQAHLNLGLGSFVLDQTTEAQQAYQTAIQLFEANSGPEDSDLATALEYMAQLHLCCDRLDEAQAAAERALSIWEKTLPSGDVGSANAIRILGLVALSRGSLGLARDQLARASRLVEQAYGAEDATNIDYLLCLGLVHTALDEYPQAESVLGRSLALSEKRLGAAHPTVADHAQALGGVYWSMGRLIESLALFERALEINRSQLGEQNTTTATTYRDIAGVYALQGRYAKAEETASKAINIFERVEGKNSIQLADTLEVLAQVYEQQNRNSEAVKILERVVDIYRQSPYAEHVGGACGLVGLARAYMVGGRYDESKELLLEAIRLAETMSGGDSISHAYARFWLGMLYFKQGQYEDAEQQIKWNLEIAEKLLPADSLDFGYDWSKLAEVYAAQGRYEEADELLERALENLERAQALPADRYAAYLLRARLAWRRGDQSEALADLRTAMGLAEDQRGHATGAELERATFFSSFAEAFEQMVAWQVERADVGEVLAAMERARARSLLDELTMPGADLGLGHSASEREQLRRREVELKQRVASVEKKLEKADRKSSAGQQLFDDLSLAKRQLYEYHRDARGRNPIYRQLLSAGGGPPRLSQIRRRLVAADRLLLVYLIGESGGYLAAVGSDEAQVTRLTVSRDDANILEVEPGPLTAERLNEVLINTRNTGVMQLMRTPEQPDQLNGKLAALWRTIIPTQQRDAITSGHLKRLIVVPDGPLALLPFETLVVQPGERPEYLLDAGPPITYGPSATVLYNLAQRDNASTPDGHEPVLTVGDPVYAESGADSEITQVTATRYVRSGGELTPLPFSGIEADWVSKAFEASGVSSKQLLRDQATETNVRQMAAGRQIVHLACHGLADQSYGNFFGALALTRGGGAEARNDGFLTLAEVYELDLASCQLAILSACETNFGPAQKGEGVWTLSRGFLVAGSQRVVASNWLVDDQAAANLVSYFCGGVATGIHRGEADYAGALQAAKRWIRGQEKWSSPYYWGSLVHVGPG